MLKEQSKRIENLYNSIKVNDMFVEMQYSNNNKSFSECILNILKTKINNN